MTTCELALNMYIVFLIIDFFLSPSLQSLHSDSSQLSEAIGRASSLAESVSSKVRILDLAKVCAWDLFFL